MIKLKKDIIKNNNSSVKDNIKNIDYTEKIRTSKEEIQRKTVEESQKENIKAASSAEKTIKETNTPHISVRDFSGKIKYDKIKGNKEHSEKTDDIKTSTHSEIIKPYDSHVSVSSNIPYIPNNSNSSISKERTDTKKPQKNNAFSYKKAAHNDIAKAKTSNDIIKNTKQSGSFKYRFASGNTDIIKNSDTKPTEKNFVKSEYKRKGKKRYGKAKRIRSDIGKGNNISTSSSNISSYESNAAYNYVENIKNDSVKSVSEKVFIGDKQLEVDILSQNYESSLSYTGKDYLKARDHPPSLQRSKFSELAHKRTVEAIKEKNKTAETNSISSFADISDNEQKQAYSSVVKDENVYNGIVKEENSFTETVKEEKNHSDMIKSEKSLVLPEKKNITDNKPISQKAPKKDSKTQRKKSEKGIVSYGGNAAANAVESEIDNSVDKGLKTLKSGTMATITVGEILKPEKITKGVRRRKKFNKDKTAQNIKNLGIKAEFRNQMKDTFLQANNSSKKALNTGGKAILKSIRSEISEIGEDNLAFKAVDDAISTVETAVSIEKGTVAVVNSGITAAKAIKNTSVAIVKAP